MTGAVTVMPQESRKGTKQQQQQRENESSTVESSAPSSASSGGAQNLRKASSGTRKLAAEVTPSLFGWDVAFVTSAAGLHALCLLGVYWRTEGRVAPFADSSPLLPAVASVLYLASVLLGPRIMASRAAFSLTGGMLVYNIYQAVFNGFVVVAAVAAILQNDFFWWGQPLRLTDASQTGLGWVIYLHYSNKYLEFIDSAFMVARKKDEQLSFLHCWHHFLMPWVWFYVLRYGGGGDAYFGAMINSFVHVWMYLFYACKALHVEVPWKRQLTNMQMVQFCVCAAHSIYVTWLGDAVYPRRVGSVQFFVMAQMFVLFLSFYRKAYSAKRGKKNE